MIKAVLLFYLTLTVTKVIFSCIIYSTNNGTKRFDHRMHEIPMDSTTNGKIGAKHSIDSVFWSISIRGIKIFITSSNSVHYKI